MYRTHIHIYIRTHIRIQIKSGVDRKLRVMLKDLNEQRRNEFEIHDWAKTMIADELFNNNPEFEVNIDDGH